MSEINVAVADDNERILDLLGEMIDEDKDLNLVGKANNGEDAYTLIKEKQPDVVLLDLIMPKMDGLSVMELVNENKELKKRPDFIVITAIGQERITEDAFKRGASYYILKPFNNEMILNRIKSAGAGRHHDLHMTSCFNAGTYQRLSLLKRCHHDGCGGYGCAECGYESAVSDGGKALSDDSEPRGKSDSPCD